MRFQSLSEPDGAVARSRRFAAWAALQKQEFWQGLGVAGRVDDLAGEDFDGLAIFAGAPIERDADEMVPDLHAGDDIVRDDQTTGL